MKKSFPLLIASLLSFTAFAQGKIGFNNDSLHLVYWDPILSPTSVQGQAVNSDNIPNFVQGLVVDLYMGTSSSLLHLYATTTFGPLAAGPGKWTSQSVIANTNATTGAPPIPGGTTVFVEVAVHSIEEASPNIFDPAFFANNFLLFGFSTEFTFTLGGGITYPPMWSQTSGTWPPGTFPMDQYGSGSRGAIDLHWIIPEPSTFALSGLGVAAMLILRRRK
jgi:hypothetical protein